MIAEDAQLEIRGQVCPYVGRGGLKLEKALNTFVIDLKGAEAMDIGASTGGFTDCMLQRGARKVYAVDVGYGQLDWKLRSDDLVGNMERVNFRYSDRSQIDYLLHFASIDVSFISLSHIFPVVRQILRPDACLVCLVKPQFEAGREQVGRGGIVRDPAVHREVLLRTAETARQQGFVVYGLTYSPMTGAKGNIEYLMMLEMPQAAEEEGVTDDPDRFVETVDRVVEEAHAALGK